MRKLSLLSQLGWSYILLIALWLLVERGPQQLATPRAVAVFTALLGAG